MAGSRRAGVVALHLFVAVLASLPCTAAFANSRIPGATGLAIHPTDEQQWLLGLTYGLALTRDGGASWAWLCEQQIDGDGSDVDPSIVVTSDGTLIVLSLANGSVLVSRDDGCTFETALGPWQDNRAVDLTLDPSQPERVLALLSTVIARTDAGQSVYRNLVAHSRDHGRSWEVLAELPDDMALETLEVAASDRDRIYVSGTASADPLEGIVERSDDGGLTWTRTTVRLPTGSGGVFISGVHPQDPDRLWVRVPGRGDVFGLLPARLWLSMDAGATFDTVGETGGGMLGFALSPDGGRVAFGGPTDGLFIVPSDASAAPSKVADMPVTCLRWTARGLYACAAEPISAFSLGFAAEPTQGFEPLWQRANSCRATCAPPSSLEMTCRPPWERIAPRVGAVCDGSQSTSDAGSDAGLSVPEPRPDGGSTKNAVDAAPVTSERASGCAVAFPSQVHTPWWLLFFTFLTWARLRRGFAAWFWLASSWLAACTSDTEPIAHLETEFKGCPAEIPEFSLGMTALSADGQIEASLVAASPAPPLRYFNDWTVRIAAAGGEPVEGLTLRSAHAFMPVHGHYGKPDPKVAPRDAEPGVFDLNDVNLMMRGPWEVRLALSSKTREAELIFHVCVEE